MAKPLTPAKRNQTLQGAVKALGRGDAKAAYKAAALIAKNDPADSDALILLAQAAPGARATKEALRVIASSAKAKPPGEDMLICWGNLKASVGDFAGAEVIFRKAADIAPASLGAKQNLANVLMQNGKPGDAVALFTDLIDRGGGWQAHLGLANAAMMLGDWAQAESALTVVLNTHPLHIGALNNLGQILMERGLYDQAALHLEKAHKAQPDHPGVLLNLASLRRRQEQLGDAIALVRRCLQLHPDFANAYANLCDMLEMSNKIDELREVVAAGLDRFPQHAGLLVQAARLDRRDGDINGAIQRLSGVTDTQNDVNNAAARHHELGVLYDKVDDPTQAFGHFTRAKDYFAVLSRQWGITSDLFFDEVATMDAVVEETDFRALSGVPDPDKCKAPCFIIGFLRSGTTLLHQILDSHDDVTVVDEKPMSIAARAVLEGSIHGFPQGIATLDGETAQRARRAYFDSLETQLVGDVPGPVLVDKFPFNLMRAPLLWRLFPEATFVLAVRHPVDVCLSCFMQAFQPTAVTSPFLTMSETVKAYTALMDMWLTFAAKAPINLVTIRYEDMIADQEGVTRYLFDSMDLSWTDEAMKFYEHAQQNASVANPSYHQVIQPLYSDAVQRWRRYEDHLKPFYPQLSPYLKAFGYESL